MLFELEGYMAEIEMKKITLSRSEKAIERAVLRGEYRRAPQEEFDRIAEAIARRKKDAVLNKS